MVEFLLSGLVDASLAGLVVYTLVVTHVTIIAVTIYLHRSQAHRALDVKAPLAHFFRFWLWLTTGMSTRAWAAIHRKHHAKCETDEDPHSPQIKGLRKVFWQGAELYKAEAKNSQTLEKYGHGTPNDWLERKLYLALPWQGCGLMLFINFFLFGIPGISVWGIQMLWIPVLAAGVVNGIGHFWGYRNFDCPDSSTNISPIGILIGGEELHNNHHAHATSAKLSSKWYEFDIGWMYIRMLSVVGLVKVKKVAKAPKLLDRAHPHLHLGTVQALISDRYEVLARYGKSLKKAFHLESHRLLREARSEEEHSLLSGAKELLVADEQQMSADQRKSLAKLCEKSELIHKLVDMRRQLRDIWERGNLSREQMLAKLQNWCDEAERSGIRLLQEISSRIRRYA